MLRIRQALFAAAIALAAVAMGAPGAYVAAAAHVSAAPQVRPCAGC
jgi:hypothetical protein